MTPGLFNSSERIFLLGEEFLIKKDEKQDFSANSHHLGEEVLKIHKDHIFMATMTMLLNFIGKNKYTFDGIIISYSKIAVYIGFQKMTIFKMCLKKH